MTPRNGAVPADWFAAADLGATSGRVIAGRLEAGRFELDEVARFDNRPIQAEDGLHWDFDDLIGQVRRGLKAADEASGHQLASVGIDTWGVDYGRLDAAGDLLEQPFHYRDRRTEATPAEVFTRLPSEQLYARAGLQVMDFNTIFQFVAQAGDPDWPRVARTLLMPDLLAYRLTGQPVAEVTIASTTGLLDVAARQWSGPTCAFLADQYGLPLPRMLPRLVEPGTVIGPIAPDLMGRPVGFVAVAEHDTASAVVAVPSLTPNFAFISSGTWSLVGLELDEPVLSPASLAASFTNELGLDHTVRYLKNVMGLWVLNECVSQWQAGGLASDLAWLLDQAAGRPGLEYVIDMDDASLMPAGDMIGRVRALAAATGQGLDPDPVAMTRCIVDSLALAYRHAIQTACALTGRRVEAVHIVGGGSRNGLLCQLTAEATGLPVVAGPAEGTALGNLLVQARAMGALSGGLTDLRRVAVASSDLTTYQPGVLDLPAARWAEASRRIKPDAGRQP